MSNEQSAIPNRLMLFWRRKWVRQFAICMIILGPCLFAFANKFAELIMLFRSESDWTFVLTPVVNYLLASAGFICLFFWAMFNGMFYDIEKPKHHMLANEELLEKWELDNQVRLSPQKEINNEPTRS